MKVPSLLAAFLLLFLLLSENIRGHTKAKQIDGIGFSGTVFLLPYNLGVFLGLREAGLTEDRRIPLAGASGGAVTSSLSCSGASVQETIQGIQNIFKQCSDPPGVCIGNTSILLLDLLERTIPKDSSFKRCDGHLHVELSEVINATVIPPCVTENVVGLQVSKFQSRHDLITSLQGTTYLPRFIGPDCYTYFNEIKVIDGGYADNLPCPPNTDANGRFCLKVSAQPKEVWSKVQYKIAGDIYPGIRGNDTLTFDVNAYPNISYNITACSEKFNDLVQAGKEDALFWLKINHHTVRSISNRHTHRYRSHKHRQHHH